MDSIKEVVDSVVVGQIWNDDTRVVLFVQLRDNLILDEELRSQIRQSIKMELSPKHTPEKILQVTDIPKTLSGKVVELAVTHAIHGREIENLDALSNPEALAQFKNRPELEN